MNTEIIFNAHIDWEFTNQGEIDITGIRPQSYNSETKCYEFVTLTDSEEKALIYALTKSGVIDELIEAIENENDFDEWLLNRYECQKEDEYLESRYDNLYL